VGAKLSVSIGAIWATGVLFGASPVLAAPIFVGNTGWSWGNPAPQGNTLNEVVFVGAQGFAVGEKGTVLRSEDGGEDWVGVVSGTRDALSEAQELDPNTVIVGGECAVRESTNAGVSFQPVRLNEPESECSTKVASFSFLNASTGFVEQANGAIFMTSDGGKSTQRKTAVPLDGQSAEQIWLRADQPRTRRQRAVEN
jgi:photosystem II stability/assembly factor-like uncharacterized protein